MSSEEKKERINLKYQSIKLSLQQIVKDEVVLKQIRKFVEELHRVRILASTLLNAVFLKAVAEFFKDGFETSTTTIPFEKLSKCSFEQILEMKTSSFQTNPLQHPISRISTKLLYQAFTCWTPKTFEQALYFKEDLLPKRGREMTEKNKAREAQATVKPLNISKILSDVLHSSFLPLVEMESLKFPNDPKTAFLAFQIGSIENLAGTAVTEERTIWNTLIMNHIDSNIQRWHKQWFHHLFDKLFKKDVEQFWKQKEVKSAYYGFRKNVFRTTFEQWVDLDDETRWNRQKLSNPKWIETWTSIDVVYNWMEAQTSEGFKILKPIAKNWKAVILDKILNRCKHLFTRVWKQYGGQVNSETRQANQSWLSRTGFLPWMGFILACAEIEHSKDYEQYVRLPKLFSLVPQCGWIPGHMVLKHQTFLTLQKMFNLGQSKTKEGNVKKTRSKEERADALKNIQKHDVSGTCNLLQLPSSIDIYNVVDFVTDGTAVTIRLGTLQTQKKVKKEKLPYFKDLEDWDFEKIVCLDPGRKSFVGTILDMKKLKEETKLDPKNNFEDVHTVLNLKSMIPKQYIQRMNFSKREMNHHSQQNKLKRNLEARALKTTGMESFPTIQALSSSKPTARCTNLDKYLEWFASGGGEILTRHYAQVGFRRDKFNAYNAKRKVWSRFKDKILTFSKYDYSKICNARSKVRKFKLWRKGWKFSKSFQKLYDEKFANEEHWIQAARSLTQMVELENQRTLVLMGDGCFDHASKGNEPIPSAKRAFHELQRLGMNVCFVNEFRTSKLCSNCHYELDQLVGDTVKKKTKQERKDVQVPPLKTFSNRKQFVQKQQVQFEKFRTDSFEMTSKVKKGEMKIQTFEPKDPRFKKVHNEEIWGVKVCSNCKSKFCRDLNAGRNFLYKFFYGLHHQFEEPPPFTRSETTQVKKIILLPKKSKSSEKETPLVQKIIMIPRKSNSFVDNHLSSEKESRKRKEVEPTTEEPVLKKQRILPNFDTMS